MPGWNEIQARFIISTGRTGTKFLASFFNDWHPDTVGVHEPEPDLLPLAIDRAHDSVDSERVRQRIRIGRKLLCRKVLDSGAKAYLEANNRFFSVIPALLELFPNCKIAHVTRDGRDYVRSGMSRDKPWCDYYYGPGDEIAQNDLRLKATMFPDDPYHNEWEDMTPFEKIAWSWVKKDKFIYEATTSFEDVERFRFEDLLATENVEGIEDLANFFGLKQGMAFEDPAIIDRLNQPENESKEYRIPHWTEWGEERIEAFERIAGDYMRELGYGD